MSDNRRTDNRYHAVSVTACNRKKEYVSVSASRRVKSVLVQVRTCKAVERARAGMKWRRGEMDGSVFIWLTYFQYFLSVTVTFGSKAGCTMREHLTAFYIEHFA